MSLGVCALRNKKDPFAVLQMDLFYLKDGIMDHAFRNHRIINDVVVIYSFTSNILPVDIFAGKRPHDGRVLHMEPDTVAQLIPPAAGRQVNQRVVGAGA